MYLYLEMERLPLFWALSLNECVAKSSGIVIRISAGRCHVYKSPTLLFVSYLKAVLLYFNSVRSIHLEFQFTELLKHFLYSVYIPVLGSKKIKFWMDFDLFNKRAKSRNYIICNKTWSLFELALEKSIKRVDLSDPKYRFRTEYPQRTTDWLSACVLPSWHLFSDACTEKCWGDVIE